MKKKTKTVKKPTFLPIKVSDPRYSLCSSLLHPNLSGSLTERLHFDQAEIAGSKSKIHLIPSSDQLSSSSHKGFWMFSRLFLFLVCCF